MATTVDFEEWIASDGPSSEEEKTDLITAVTQGFSEGNYSVIQRKRQYIVEGWSGNGLCLANEQARASFLKYAKALEIEDELDEGYEWNMENSNS